MSAGVIEGDYMTEVTALANTNKTEVFGVATDGSEGDGAYVSMIRIVDATGSAAAGPIIVHCVIGTGITERVLHYRTADLEADWPLEILGSPIALRLGGTISVTADNNVHVWVGYKRVQHMGAGAQKR